VVHPSGTFPGPFLDLSWSLPVGDLAVVHPSGYLEIKDRAKDIIISGGENISTVEVEAVRCRLISSLYQLMHK